MFPANTFTIRLADADDAGTLRRLAELDSRRALRGRILIAEDDGVAVAALSIDEGRTVADPFRPATMALVMLRMRASALTCYERTPSVRDRIRESLRVTRGSVAHAEA
jgi:hypothetical protein